MGFKCDVVRQTAVALNYDLGQLPPEEAEKLYKDLAALYSPDPRRLGIEWLRDAEGLHDPEAVYQLSEFLGTREVLMLFGHSDGGEVLVIPSGEMVVPIVREAPYLMFAVTTRSHEFLLTWDDHQCLLGVGTAAPWVAKLRIAKEARQASTN
jgi:hypothetical protein